MRRLRFIAALAALALIAAACGGKQVPDAACGEFGSFYKSLQQTSVFATDDPETAFLNAIEKDVGGVVTVSVEVQAAETVYKSDFHDTLAESTCFVLRDIAQQEGVSISVPDDAEANDLSNAFDLFVASTWGGSRYGERRATTESSGRCDTRWGTSRLKRTTRRAAQLSCSSVHDPDRRQPIPGMN